MAATKRRYSKEAFARRGDAIYENDVLPHLKIKDEGKFAAIDIESSTYEIIDNHFTSRTSKQHLQTVQHVAAENAFIANKVCLQSARMFLSIPVTVHRGRSHRRQS